MSLVTDYFATNHITTTELRFAGTLVCSVILLSIVQLYL